MACKGDSRGDGDLNILKKVQALHADAVSSFRECHNLCVSSKLFSRDTIKLVDQCAYNFRLLSLSTVTVSEKVSGWMRQTITFFKYINSEASPKQKYIEIAKKAKDIAKCFKVIAAWGRVVSGKLHEAQDCLKEEVDEFQQEFEAAEQEAKYAEERKKEKYRKAARIRAHAEATERAWKAALEETEWSPIGGAIAGIGTAVISNNTSEAVSLEQDAKEEYDRASKRLRKRTREYNKAKVGNRCPT